MTSSPITNSTPRFIPNGMKDQSILPLVAQPEQLPIHLPLFYLLASTGPIDEVLMVMDKGDLTRIYGDDVLDMRSPYFTHATLMVQKVLEAGNACMIKRVASPTIVKDINGNIVSTSNLPSQSTLILTATIDSTTAVYEYQRTLDGTVVFDVNGNPLLSLGTAVASGSFTAGTDYQIVSLGTTTQSDWLAQGVVGTAVVGKIFTANSGTGAGTGTASPLTKVAGAKTIKFGTIPLGSHTLADLSAPIVAGPLTTYPLLMIQTPFVGKAGDNYGIRLWTAGPNSVMPGDSDVIKNQGALIFNAQIVAKAINGTTNVVADIYGESMTSFMLKPNAFNYKTNADLTIQSLIDNWTDDGSLTNTSPIFGPFGSVHVFEANLESVLNTLLTAETAALPVGVSGPSSIWEIDLFSAINTYNGTNFYTAYGFRVDSTGLQLTSSLSYYMQGGNDGDLTYAQFEASVIDETLNHYNDPAYPLLDTAKYPFSCIYDSGFSTPVKLALFHWLNYRKDVHVGVGTHVVGDAPLTISEEISSTINLHTAALAYAESSVWGTPACRAVIMLQSGLLINSPFTKPVSTLFDLVMKRAAYFGAGDGVAKSGLSYNINPANIVKSMKKLSSTNLTLTAQTALWTGGANFVQAYDRKSYFFPAIQTIYGIENSVLVDEIFMQICCDIQKQSANVWRQLSGRDDLTEAQFIKKSNELLLQLVDGKYDNKVIITPNTYFTPADVARGYSWVMDVSVAGNIPYTVGQINIITQRIVNATV